MPKTYGVIMAGGVGARFWPLSREKRPKQFLSIFGDESLISSTFSRLHKIVDKQNIFVVTNAVQKPAIREELNDVPERNILVEPMGRNTAPCIGLAALHIQRKDPDAVMIVVPADHVIQDVNEFSRILGNAVEIAAESDDLVTIGIEPTRPETGYGYIQYLEDGGHNNPYVDKGAYRVKTFAEKPNLATAERFLESGDFLWNSGMFIWKVGTILNEIKRLLPDMYEGLESIGDSIGKVEYLSTLDQVYRMIRGISIDYGVMEKADHVYVLRGKFGWSDVGSWDEVYRVGDKDDNGNALHGRAIARNSTNNLLFATKRTVAVYGVDDLIVVETDEAILVCKRGESQDVKELVEYLRRKHIDDLL
jgi:mannose-1-phosphate guanylyltransferase